MRNIRRVAVLGASGSMGSTSGGIFAQAGIQCLFFARSQEKAASGKKKAIEQARSGIIGNYITTYSYDSLEKELPSCDWIFEGLTEDLSIKKKIFNKIDQHRRGGSIISTVSSGLSIEEMAAEQSDDFKAHFVGTHFYNPPAKLIANELIFHDDNSRELRGFILSFCAKILRRQNIITHNVPAFAGNRIGFQFLNRATQIAEKIGVQKTDYLFGSYTGRALPPLATVDLVGLDVHKAIVDNVYKNTNDEMHKTYKMPDYMENMLRKKMLGIKTPVLGGFFSRDSDKKKLVLNPKDLSHTPAERVRIDFVEKAKSYIHDGQYSKAVDVIKTEPGEDANLVRSFILGYISYSFHRIGEVTPEVDYIHSIDKVMAYGFSWLPPSGWLDLMGGAKEVISLLNVASIEVPDALRRIEDTTAPICQIPEISRFLIVR